VVFAFGATLPTVVCAPLFVCDLVLQPGEAAKDLNVGDSVRWQITPATQSTGEVAIAHVIIKMIRTIDLLIKSFPLSR
jgi:type IV secretion system protein TrbG